MLHIIQVWKYINFILFKYVIYQKILNPTKRKRRQLRETNVKYQQTENLWQKDYTSKALVDFFFVLVRFGIFENSVFTISSKF